MSTPSLTAPVGGESNYIKSIAPEGMHVARIYQIIDLGTTEQGGNFPGKKRKIQLLFETPYEQAVFSEDNGEQPYYIRATYTLSMNEKAILRKDVTSWLGKKMSDEQAAAFDVFSLLGKECQVNVVHTTKGDNTYTNIGAITPLAKGMTCPPPINPVVAFSAAQPDMNVFGTLPQFIQDKIKESDEFIKYMDASMNATAGTAAPAAKAAPMATASEQELWEGLGQDNTTGDPF